MFRRKYAKHAKTWQGKYLTERKNRKHGEIETWALNETTKIGGKECQKTAL
jgi:hypothetical protein